MKIGVIGTGHVGLVTAAMLAHLGHEVAAVDADPDKLSALRQGRSPFFEPGLQELLTEGSTERNLRFTDRTSEVVAGAEVVFICVGTPADADGEASLVAIERAAEQIADAATGPVVVVEKSTVPAGTADRVTVVLRRRRPDVTFNVVSNPEFLREGSAVQDSLHPDRILVGADNEAGADALRSVYRSLIETGTAFIETDVRTAELAKHASNAFLSLKISYANALARLCELSGADVVAVTRVMGSDPRIGDSFLEAGLGYGGYCFPKDVAAFRGLARRLGYDFGLLDEVIKINEEAIDLVVTKLRDAAWNLAGKRIAVLGLAFKPLTDDVRLSPALRLIDRLCDLGADVVGHDPEAGAAAAAAMPTLVTAADPYIATDAAYAVVIATAWDEYRGLDWARVAASMRDRIVVDARNALDPRAIVAAGLDYHSIGRSSIAAQRAEV
jgi:UDPglucose 6-dehydrogenase